MSNTPTSSDPEKHGGSPAAVSFSPTTLSPSPAHHHPHLLPSRARTRLHNFLHPNGRRIHIASSPDDAQSLRRRLERLPQAPPSISTLPTDDPHEPFDIFISGSPEHLNALRDAQSHHETRRETLRHRHGDVYTQFAEVHTELDALAQELERVTTHGVSLEAHFSRFGYNAHVRSYDDDEDGEGEGSEADEGARTPRRSGGSSSRSSVAAPEKGFATTLKLFKKPVLRQYFHKGILWRASGSEEVQSFELFVDLLYVGIIAINGDAASEEPTGLSLLRFAITFTLSFKIWNDMAMLISWFETDDIFQRLSILFLLSCLFGYTTNITQAFDTTYATLIGFYLAARFYMAAYLVLVSFLMPTVRGVLGFYVVNTALGAALWIGSIHVEYPQQLALIFVAMFIDIAGGISYLFVIGLLSRMGPWAKRWVERYFEFTPAVNIEHRTERMNAFVTLVFGYTVVAILYQSTTNGVDAFFGKGILGLIQAFVFNWLYFEIDSSNLNTHAIRRSKYSAILWTMLHLPFIMSFVLAGGALARLVVAADTTSSHLSSLTPAYQARSATDIATGIRWFYSAGLGVALFCMVGISLTHVHKDIEGLRMPKRVRLLCRTGVATVLVCLPLATRLDSLELVGTVTALVVAVLGVELWATSCCNEALFGRSQACRYTGRCGKGRMEALIKGGGAEVVVDGLGGEKGRNGGMALGP